MNRYCIVVNLTPFPIRVTERHRKDNPFVTVIKPGEASHLPCYEGSQRSFMLSTSMSRPYSHLWSIVDLPGEIPLGSIGNVKPYAIVRRKLQKHFLVNYTSFRAGHMFELSYDPCFNNK
jgi:hypothetical protein